MQTWRPTSNNNFGSNSRTPNLTLRQLKLLAGDVHSREDTEPKTSFDDMFDEPMYRVSRTSFNRQTHALGPRTQTHYRKATRHELQGLPEKAESAHWDYDSSVRRASEQQRTRIVPKFYFRG